MGYSRHHYYVYILSNASKLLYTGMTNNLARRLQEHREKKVEGFTKKHNLHRLVYYEVHRSVEDAIRREKQIKKWNRSKRVALIEKENPEWEDLSKGWD